MSKSWHPTLEETALWVIDSHSDHLTRKVREHFTEGCDVCGVQAEELRRLAAEIPGAFQGRPSENLLQHCREVFPSRDTGESLLLVAELMEDTQQLTGVRGEAADGRHLLFQAGEFDIDIRLRPAGSRSRHEVRGQIHAPRHMSAGDVRVQMLRGAQVVGEGSTDPHGEFKIMATGTGTLRLELVGDRIRIRTPEISV